MAFWRALFYLYLKNALFLRLAIQNIIPWQVLLLPKFLDIIISTFNCFYLENYN